MVHLIHYKLQGYRPRAEYERLADAIKKISGVWCHIPESTWLIETESAAATVADRLAPLTLLGDSLFVTRIYNDWKCFSLTPDQVQWLQARNFGSLADVLRSMLPLPTTGLGALAYFPKIGGK